MLTFKNALVMNFEISKIFLRFFGQSLIKWAIFCGNLESYLVCTISTHIVYMYDLRIANVFVVYFFQLQIYNKVKKIKIFVINLFWHFFVTVKRTETQYNKTCYAQKCFIKRILHVHSYRMWSSLLDIYIIIFGCAYVAVNIRCL